MRLRSSIGSILSAAVLVACVGGCGESEKEKAEKTVCSAKTTISQRATELSQIQSGNVSASRAKEDLQVIGKELEKVAEATKQLTGAARQEIESATSKFTSELKELAGQLTTLSPNELRSRVSALATQLSTDYTNALASVKC